MAEGLDVSFQMNTLLNFAHPYLQSGVVWSCVLTLINSKDQNTLIANQCKRGKIENIE